MYGVIHNDIYNKVVLDEYSWRSAFIPDNADTNMAEPPRMFQVMFQGYSSN